MYGWVDGGMEGWMDGWMDRWTGRMNDGETEDVYILLLHAHVSRLKLEDLAADQLHLLNLVVH